MAEPHRFGYATVMMTRTKCVTLTLFLASSLMTSCAGFKSASPLSIPALRDAPAVADVGYTNGVGVPSLAERFAERKDLKFAIVQVAYGIQGRPVMTFTKDLQSFGGVTSWTRVTTPEIMLPASVVQAAAVHAAKTVEQQLSAQGFGVIPFEKVAETAAYEKHYGDYPKGYGIRGGMMRGFTICGAYPMGVYKVPTIFAWGNLHQVWPDAQALADIKAELGQDTLMLCLKIETKTMRGGSGNLSASAVLNVADPDYAGYGIGGYGHLVTALDAHTDPNGADVPGFVARDGKQWLVNWTPVYKDLARVHKAFAKGMATELKKMAFPPKQ